MSSTIAAPASGDGVAVPLRWMRWACLCYWLTLAVFTHWPRLDLGTPPPDESGLPTDKFLHFGAFGLLCILLFYAKPAGRRASQFMQVLVTTLAVGIYAYVDEFTQVFFADRVASWSDVFANWAAVGAFFLAGALRPMRDFARGHPLALWRMVLVALSALFLVMCAVPPWVLGRLQLLPWMRRFNREFRDFSTFDHIGHFVFAMLLTWLLLAARPFGARRPRLSAALSLTLLALSAPVIEHLQLRFGRNYEWQDIRAHGWGMAAGIVIAGLWRFTLPLSRHALALIPLPRGGQGGFVRQAAIVSTLTFVSRVTGLARDAVLAASFGRSAVTSAFLIGFLIPNLFRRLFGEGALSSALIPEYAHWMRRDPPTARRLVWLTLGTLAVVLGGITILGQGVLLMTLRARDWSPAAALAIELTMWMLPYMPLVCLVAVLGAILQVHGRFAAAAGAPIILNLVMIGAILWAAEGLQSGQLFSSGSSQAIDPAAAQAMTIVAGSVIIAGLLQLAFVALPARDVEKLDLQVGSALQPFKRMMTAFVPMVAGLAIFQFNALLDSLIAMGLSPPSADRTTFELLGWSIAYPIADKGQVASLHWAQRLYQFPLGVFGIAIATAVFPALSHAAARIEAGEHDDSHFRRILQRGLRITVFIGLPASVGLILVGLPLTRAVFERGEFTLQDARYVAEILTPYAAAVWAYSMVHVLTRAFYALKDPRTPVRVSLALAGLNFVVNLVLVWPLGARGLAWSTALTAVLQCGVLVRKLGHRTPGIIDRRVVGGWVRCAVATGLMAAAAWVAMHWGAGLVPSPWSPGPAGRLWWELLLTVGSGAGFYALAAWVLRCEELSWILGRKGADRSGSRGSR